ncbi:hypothetical protein BASA81_009097 [Batrachochytrium salamandrivorans]|nr:hypothetical protein BASA81_009097 [Batrachochytrium salamandrivorans]
MEYVMSQASRIASGFKDLRKSHEELLKELVLLQSQYDLYLSTCTDLAFRLDSEKQTALDKLQTLEQQRASAVLESVKVKNQKRDVEAWSKQSREIELETNSTRQALAEGEQRKRDTEKRLAAAELVASSQFKLVQAKRQELDRVNASLASLHKHQEEELQMQRAKYAQQIAQSKSTLASLREQEQTFLGQLECLQLEREKSMGEIAKRHAQIQLYEERARKAKDSLTSKDENVHMALQTLNKAQESSEHRLASLKQEISLYWTKCETATRECNQFQNDLSESASQITRVQTRIDVLVAQEGEWKLLLQQAEAKYAGCLQALGLARQELESKLERVEEAKLERDSTAQALSEEQSQVSQTLGALEQSKDMERGLRSELMVIRNALEQLRAPSPPPAAIVEQDLAVPEPPVFKNEFEEQIESLEGELALIKQQLMDSDAKRRNLLNQVQTIKGNIRVLARVGPLLSATGGGVICSLDGMSLELKDHSRFSFNRVFDSDTSQLEVFDEVTSFVQSALDGYDVCLVSSGQAKSGKTFTMLGDLSSPSARGIIPRSVDLIVRQLAELRESSEWYFKLECAYVEIAQDDGEVRELFGGKRMPVTDPDYLFNMLQRTALPQPSSHRVFSLFISGRNEVTRAELQGSLHLCDLSSADTVSSLALASSLKQQGFKSSKLTDLLKPCLSGEGKTLLICNLSPGEDNLRETANVLKFAQQVNQAEPSLAATAGGGARRRAGD